MKIKKVGYVISILLYIASAIISHIFKLSTTNTYWAFFSVLVIIIPAFTQTIFNIKANKNADKIIILYILLSVFIILFLTGLIILFLLLFNIIKLPLYWIYKFLITFGMAISKSLQM